MQGCLGGCSWAAPLEPSPITGSGEMGWGSSGWSLNVSVSSFPFVQLIAKQIDPCTQFNFKGFN